MLFIILVALLLLSLFLLLIMAFVFWVHKIKSLHKNNRPRKAIFVAIAPVLVVLLFSGGIWVEYQRIRQERTQRVFNVEDIGPAKFAHAPQRAFNGDGYSLHVYGLPEEVKRMLTSGGLVDFPLIEEHFQDYEAVLTWSETPISAKYEGVVNFAVLENDRDGDEIVDLSSHANNIRNALSAQGNYYSFVASKQIVESGGRPGNIDMYVVDVDSDLIYILKHDT